jgi:hypothetical protein
MSVAALMAERMTSIRDCKECQSHNGRLTAVASSGYRRSVAISSFSTIDFFFLSYQIFTKREYNIATGERAKEKKQ